MARTKNPKYYSYDKKQCDWVIQFWNPETKKLMRVTRRPTEASAAAFVKQYLLEQEQDKIQEKLQNENTRRSSK